MLWGSFCWRSLGGEFSDPDGNGLFQHEKVPFKQDKGIMDSLTSIKII